MNLGLRERSGPNHYFRPQSIAARCRADKINFQPVNTPPLSEIAYQHLRRRVELAGDNVEVTVVVEIDQGGCARAQRAQRAVNRDSI